MPRVQTRISDHRTPDLVSVGRGRFSERPTVLAGYGKGQPNVTIQLFGSKEKLGQSQGQQDSALRSECQLRAGELLQCEYHLLDFDRLENRSGSTLRSLGPFRSLGSRAVARTVTLKRTRRGAVVGQGKKRGLIRSRDPQPATTSRPEIAAIENSVIWETSGKGDTDFGVHFFERREAHHHQPQQLYRPYRFRTVCPNSPLSYQGQLLSISWLVRVRVFLNNGDGLTFERRFQLLPS